LLNQDPDVIYQYSGGSVIRHIKTNVVMGQLITGEVFDLLTGNKSEKYNDRRLIFKMQMDNIVTADCYFLADYLYATDKQIIINGNTIDVVNDDKNLELFFDYWEKSSWRSSIELKFIRKTPGIYLGYLEDQDGTTIDDQDGNPIEET